MKKIKIEKIKISFFGLKHLPATPEWQQKISAHLVQPFGRLQATYLYIYDFLFNYIEDQLKSPALPVAKKEKEKKLYFFQPKKPRPPLSVHKKISPFCPAVWPAISNMHISMNVLFYYIDLCIFYHSNLRKHGTFSVFFSSFSFLVILGQA